jgi:hypothetical protein
LIQAINFDEGENIEFVPTIEEENSQDISIDLQKLDNVAC